MLWSRERCTFFYLLMSQERGQLIRRQFWSRIDQCWVSAAVVLRHEHNGMMMGRLTVSRRHFVTSQSDSLHIVELAAIKRNTALYNENEWILNNEWLETTSTLTHIYGLLTKAHWMGPQKLHKVLIKARKNEKSIKVSISISFFFAYLLPLLCAVWYHLTISFHRFVIEAKRRGRRRDKNVHPTMILPNDVFFVLLFLAR